MLKFIFHLKKDEKIDKINSEQVTDGLNFSTKNKRSKRMPYKPKNLKTEPKSML